jgi:hypothetical protein
MEYSKEFKEALSNFNPKEKDKLIFRLLRKDKILSQKLYFELIENKTTDEKRQEIDEHIAEKVEYYAKMSNSKYYLTLIRGISAGITLHTKVTTDKFGEVFLNIFLVNEILKSRKDMFYKQGFEKNYKLYLYLINKIFRALTLTLKLDEDYYLDLDTILKETLESLKQNDDMVKLSINNGLDFNYFQTENIPEDIANQIKELKAEGYLR